MWGQTRWAQTRWGRAIWRSGVSAAAAILLAMTSILGSGTPTYAQAAVGTGSQVLRVEVECLEAELRDLGPSWPARARPVHMDDAPDPRG